VIPALTAKNAAANATAIDDDIESGEVEDIVEGAPPAPIDSQSLRALPPSDPGYQEQSAATKQRALWKEIAAQPYKELPDLDSAGIGGGVGFIGKLRNFLRVFNLAALSTTFDRTGDVRPPRDKLFHPFGSAAMVRFEPVPGSGYTGLFASGAPGIARLSLATPPKGGFVPGLALKLLVDGRPSQNIEAIHGLEGEAEPRFFGPTLSNVIAPPKALFVRFLAWVTSLVADPFRRPVDHFATVDASGRQVSAPHAPRKLEFRPSAEVQAMTANASSPGPESPYRQAPESAGDFRAGFEAISPGTVIYEVYARSSDESPAMLIGRLRTTSSFVASDFEDRALFFNHPR
jgi:hypothetical protein